MNKIKHYQQEEIYHQYLDQELELVEHQAFEAHLSSCQECISRLEAAEMLIENLSSLPEIALEIDLTQRVLSSIKYRQPEIQPALRRATTRQIAVALILLLVSWPYLAQLGLPTFAIAIPDVSIQIPTFDPAVMLISLLEKISSFQIPQLSAYLPELSIPDLPQTGLSLFLISSLLVSTSLLWWFANRILLVKHNINGG